MAFGVVLFTLLAKARRMQLLLKRLGLVGRTTCNWNTSATRRSVLAARAAHQRLEQLHADGAFATSTWGEVASELDYYGRQAALDLQALVKQEPTLRTRELLLARREMLRAQRSEISVLLRDGVISDEVYSEMISQIDGSLLELERIAENGPDLTEQEATA